MESMNSFVNRRISEWRRVIAREKPGMDNQAKILFVYHWMKIYMLS